MTDAPRSKGPTNGRLSQEGPVSAEGAALDVDQLRARRDELQYLAQMSALEGLTMNAADEKEFRLLERRIERHEKKRTKSS